MPKEKIQVFLDESDIEYVSSVKNLLGFESKSETVRFIIKLLKLILPKAPYVAYIVSELMKQEENTLKNRKRGT